MSDADEFDKEAERERLREKYEADQAEREATQRMSELLLQGATMTNRHCDNCGDPLFRYDGEQFCPSCGAGTGGVADRAPEGGPGAGAIDRPDAASAHDATGGDAATTTDTGAEPRTDTGAESRTDIGAEPRTDVTSDSETPPATHPGAGPGRSRDTPPSRGTDGAPPTGDASPTGASATAPEAGDPRAALAATAARMAERADAAGDPRQAREWLAAAREAAEALAALEGR